MPKGDEVMLSSMMIRVADAVMSLSQPSGAGGEDNYSEEEELHLLNQRSKQEWC